MRAILSGAVTAALFALPGVAAGGEEPTVGAVLAANCYICHGPNGASASRVPSLARLSGKQIADAVREARSGKKPGTIMVRIAKGYTDAQIEAIAAYFEQAKR
jgi:sulfide dehydrogenase cytochrome subunit